MITIQKPNGSELEISNESHVYIKADSKDFFINWDELDEETKRQLSELVNEMDEILNRGAKLLIK